MGLVGGKNAEQVGLCLLTRLGVLRLLTNMKVMAGHPVRPDQALKAWAELADDPRCVYVESIFGMEEFLRRGVNGRAPTPNLWTDAWLAALAAAAGYRLTTFDRGFRSFSLEDLALLGP